MSTGLTSADLPKLKVCLYIIRPTSTIVVLVAGVSVSIENETVLVQFG